MDIWRIVRHLCTPQWATRRAFPRQSLKAIEEAVRRSEGLHRGEIRFAVETSLELPSLLRGEMAAARAQDIFSRLRVWDTAENNGVLIYLLMADRDVEIVADRGVHERVGASGWEQICQRMESAFRAGRFEAGVIEGIEAVTGILAREYPASGAGTNELPNRPVML
jgi:uncharacterized membrane protein